LTEKKTIEDLLNKNWRNGMTNTNQEHIDRKNALINELSSSRLRHPAVQRVITELRNDLELLQVQSINLVTIKDPNEEKQDSTKISLTTQQIYLMGQFAGLKVEAPEEDELDTEFILDTKLRIASDQDNPLEYEGLAMYTAEYPEEGAVPLES
jgi:hypothetical protein